MNGAQLGAALMRPWDEPRVALLMMPPQHTTAIGRKSDGTIEVEDARVLDRITSSDLCRFLLRVVLHERGMEIVEGPMTTFGAPRQELYPSHIYGWEKRMGKYIPLPAQSVVSPYDTEMRYTPQDAFPLVP